MTKPKLLDRVREQIRLKHYSHRTEKKTEKRHHLHESAVQREVKKAIKQSNIIKKTFQCKSVRIQTKSNDHAFCIWCDKRNMPVFLP